MASFCYICAMNKSYYKAASYKKETTMKVNQSRQQLQSSINHLMDKLAKTDLLTRPVMKNIAQLLFGILAYQHVHVSKIARALPQNTTPKKTQERLRRNLNRPELDRQLLLAHHQISLQKIGRMQYCIIDISDIQKPYSITNAGLAKVRDGSKHQPVGWGYWWINAIMSDGDKLLPVHSELFSIEHENGYLSRSGNQRRVSENLKILGIAKTIHAINKKAIMVLDRGGDRRNILVPFLKAGIYFIVRGNNKRNLKLRKGSSKVYNIGELAAKTRTSKHTEVTRRGRHNRSYKKHYQVGVRTVYLDGYKLWLVVCRNKRAGLSWFLVSLPGELSKEQVMDTVMEGYSQRWQIDEYHRAIKQQFKLEQIMIKNYHGLKTMVLLVMLAAVFILNLPAHLQTILLIDGKMLLTRNHAELPVNLIYRLTTAIQLMLTGSNKRAPPIMHKDNRQLKLLLIFTPDWI